MTAVLLDTSTSLVMEYDSDVTPTGFDPGDWQTIPGALTSTTVSQSLQLNQLTVDFTGDITSETDVTYSGDKAGLLTPQTLPIQI